MQSHTVVMENLLSRFGYLIHELQALQQLIEVFPLDRKPPNGKSVVEHLESLFLAEKTWVLPIFEKISLSPQSPLFSESMPSIEELDEIWSKNEEKRITSSVDVIKNGLNSRNALYNICTKFSKDDLEKTIWIQSLEEQISVLHYLFQFLDLELEILKSISRFISDVQSEQLMMRSAGLKG